MRRLIGVPKLQHIKAVALLASAYRLLAKLHPEVGYDRAATGLADQLVRRALRFETGIGWGYDFDVQTRWGYYRRGQPNAVVTAFAAHALLDSVPSEPLYADAARQAIRYAMSKLLIERDGAVFFAYFAGSQTPIHNANLLVASLAARCEQQSELSKAAEAVAFSLAHQRPDGSWPYGEGPGLGWIDGFHTAYILESLARWHEATGEASVEAAIVRGLDFYFARLVDSDGAARAGVDARYPIDIHAAASAISALSLLDRYDTRAFPCATNVLRWTLRHMRRGDGRFAFQQHRHFRNSVPYIRWSDGHMLLALGRYLTRASENGTD